MNISKQTIEEIEKMPNDEIINPFKDDTSEASCEIGNLKSNPLKEEPPKKTNIETKEETIPKKSEELNNHKNSNVNIKYKIINLYWLINKKIENKTYKLKKYEPHIVNIGYNADFDNLRIVFFKFKTKDSIGDNFINVNVSELTQLTSINIHSEFSEKLFYYLHNEWSEEENTKDINLIERIFINNWSPNNTVFRLYPREKKIDLMTVTPSNEKYIFTFDEWKYNCIINSLNFLRNNQSWTLSMMSKI